MFRTMTGDAGCRNVLFDIEDGAEGEEVNIEAGDDTEVGLVKNAVDPGKPTDTQIEEHRMAHPPTCHGVGGSCWAVDVVYIIVYAPVR